MKKKLSATALTLTLVMLCSLFPLTAFAGEYKNDKNPADLDMIFIGAHPDDEAGGLSTYGQWIEQYQFKMGIVTVTRGEGGGNAVGPEEGADLGILREREERDAVSIAGITQVFNLDKVDFYYNVSAPLTEQVWEHDSTLEKVVRTIRITQPEIIFTMNPSPTPGNHGHHQYAARMAVEAFYAAADPAKFPQQLTEEGLQTWAAKKLVYRGAAGTGTNSGAACETTFVPAEPTDKVYSVWSGRMSEKQGKTWAQLEREAQRKYASQGWAVFADVPANPNELGCDRFTEFDSRVPVTDNNLQSTALLEGALLSGPGSLALGTELFVTTSDYSIAPGEKFTVDVEITNNSQDILKDAVLALELPAGLQADGGSQTSIKKLAKGETEKISFNVTASAALEAKRYRLKAKLTADGKEGYSSHVIAGVPEVQSTLAPLPHVKEYQQWTAANGVQHLDNLIKPVFSIGVGETKSVRIVVTNNSGELQNSEVSLQLPEGFEAVQSKLALNLPANETSTAEFSVKNSDTSLKTSNQGGANGDYNFTVTTETNNTSVVQQAAINLVPVTEISQAASEPAVDGYVSGHEYHDHELDLSRVWEGQAPSSAEDGSGHAKVSWYNDALYFYVKVKDDTLGAVLSQADAKRHWRTDSVEIAIDPRGNSENTSSTFKVGIFPTTSEGKPAAYRDADNHQGPIDITAKGMEIASQIDTSDYSGYTIEAKIPFSALPAAVDPRMMAFNIFIYDSDTQDKTGQTRLGWSTWGGVQGDPYRWGRGYVKEYEPDGSLPATPIPPIIPLNVARSTLSPQSILQSSLNDVPLASGQAADKNSLQIAGKPKLLNDGKLQVTLIAQDDGEANLFIWSNNQTVDKRTVSLKAKQRVEVTLTYPSSKQSIGDVLLISYETDEGKTLSLSHWLRK
ncbi:sugar-binding protein [Paenibacillus alkalitolerans]|uniref:sugar-binding protein n=1 Tax=Paenibacillus alkalitolerans TaxID=2799335 RepID=UPI0018F6E677|nr:sugar-binding protein [Paenibacillus alkalitolerans]